jgi:hypothetical protein
MKWEKSASRSQGCFTLILASYRESVSMVPGKAGGQDADGVICRNIIARAWETPSFTYQ